MVHHVCRDIPTRYPSNGLRIGEIILWSPAPPLPPSMLPGQLSVSLAVSSEPTFEYSIKHIIRKINKLPNLMFSRHMQVNCIYPDV